MENKLLFGEIVMMVVGFCNDEDLTKDEWSKILDEGNLKIWLLERLDIYLIEGYYKKWVIRLIDKIYDEVKFDLDLNSMLENDEDEI